MEPKRSCPQCGRVIPWGLANCLLCQGPAYRWSLRRDRFLLLLFVLLILLFVITSFAVRSYQAREKGLAQDWSSRGEKQLTAGQGGAALVDFRNALFHSRDNTFYQLRLAQALAATGQFPQAQNYLLNLREREPGNGPVNLELARVAVREHNTSQAVRYFHDAVYCEWEENPVVQRRAVRLELVQLLLDSDQKDAARAELIAVAANLPPGAELQAKVGTLLLKAGGYDDALRLFRQALAAEAHSAPALAGAGEGYFQIGRYAEAQRYLEQAVQQDSHLPRAAEMLDTARTVLSLDPFQHRLGEQARARRAQRGFAQAVTRLETCAAQRGIDLKAPGGNPLQTLYAEAAEVQSRTHESALRHDAELLSNVMDLVFKIEKTTSQVCGEPRGPDQALLLIARQQEGARP
jgi:tetratricopeptide (TPR) repeat protein